MAGLESMIVEEKQTPTKAVDREKVRTRRRRFSSNALRCISFTRHANSCASIRDFVFIRMFLAVLND